MRGRSKALAEMLGVSKSAISDLKNNRKPLSFDKLLRLSFILDLPPPSDVGLDEVQSAWLRALYDLQKACREHERDDGVATFTDSLRARVDEVIAAMQRETEALHWGPLAGKQSRPPGDPR